MTGPRLAPGGGADRDRGAAPQRGQSRWVDLGGPVHYLDFGGPDGAPVIVCVHGLAGSAVNWSAVAPLLTGSWRVLAPDLSGHGLTRSLERGCDVAANRALLHRFIEAVPGGPVVLMGNSMGGMVSILEAAAAPGLVAGLILVDPALPFVPARPDPLVAAMFTIAAVPVLGPALTGLRHRLPPAYLVGRLLSLCCADASRVPADVVAQHVEVARQRNEFAEAGRDLSAAARSVVRVAARSLAYRRAISGVSCPVLLLHGDRDRLIPVSVARSAARARPSWSLVVLPDAGHIPQLEVPEAIAEAISPWRRGPGRPGATRLGTPDPAAGQTGPSGRERAP